MAKFDLAVSYGKVSLGKETGSFRIAVTRKNVKDLAAFIDSIAKRRLIGWLQIGGANDSPGQSTFLEEEETKISGAFDAGSVSVDLEKAAFTVSFNLDAIDVDADHLKQFAQGSGRLIVSETKEQPKKTTTAKKPLPDRKAKEPWEKVALSELFTGAILKALNEAELNTLGDLTSHMSKVNNDLTEIAGIGDHKAEQIKDRLAEFWADQQDGPEQAA